MKIRHFALIPILAASVFGVTPSTPAHACGVSAQYEARRLVAEHFAALNAHDRDRMLAVWSPNATVVSGEPTVIATIDQAATQWLRPAQTRFSVTKIDEDPNEEFAVAHVAGVRGHRDFEDVMVVAETANGWRIVGATSRLRPVATHY